MSIKKYLSKCTEKIMANTPAAVPLFYWIFLFVLASIYILIGYIGLYFCTLMGITSWMESISMVLISILLLCILVTLIFFMLIKKQKSELKYHEAHKSVVHQRQVDTQILQALIRNEFSLEYQLQIDACTLQPFGLEALIRWNNPQLGMVPPEDFIPIAEANGLINKIGEWVLKQACMDYTQLLSSDPYQHLILSVNISVSQLENPHFMTSLKKILSETKINSQNMMLEITETALMKNPDYVIKMTSQIKALGLHFALDDFGMHYSSMRYLKNLPISIIKIDQEFVRHILINRSDAAIVSSIIQLAHGVGLKVVAEGVETEEQLQLLKKMGCEYVQGYYFIKPMSIHEMLAHPMMIFTSSK